jgi:hypothetical protein
VYYYFLNQIKIILKLSLLNLELMGLGIGDWGLGIVDWGLGIEDCGLGIGSNGFVQHKTKTLEKTFHGCPTPSIPLIWHTSASETPTQNICPGYRGFVVARRIAGKVWLIFIKQD